MPVSNINPNEGDIVKFWSNDAQGRKFAINLEPERLHKNKPTFNGVITTTQRVSDLYPGDYLLPDGTMPQATKVICDQPQAIPKKFITHKHGNVSPQDLEEIRKRVATSLGISYDNTTG